MKNLISIIAADPNSINSEIIAKLWKRKKFSKKLNIFVIGNYNLLKKQLKLLKINIKTEKINELENKNFKKKLCIYDVPLQFKKPFEVSSKYVSSYVIRSLKLGIKLANTKKISGFVNCPINKKDVFGKSDYGITEFLGKFSGLYGKEAMLIYNKELSVSPITTHIKIKKVSSSISKKIIINKITSINKFFLQKLKKKPKIAIVGLNPHNYEFRKNSEEKRIIIPAIKLLKSKNISVVGPISADTAFVNYKNNGFNVIVGMYHDQVLTPFKTLFRFNAINITVGLPFLRVSPDHGTGKNIIKKNLADPESLLRSINFFKNINV